MVWIKLALVPVLEISVAPLHSLDVIPLVTLAVTKVVRGYDPCRGAACFHSVERRMSETRM